MIRGHEVGFLVDGDRGCFYANDPPEYLFSECAVEFGLTSYTFTVEVHALSILKTMGDLCWECDHVIRKHRYDIEVLLDTESRLPRVYGVTLYAFDVPPAFLISSMSPPARPQRVRSFHVSWMCATFLI